MKRTVIIAVLTFALLGLSAWLFSRQGTDEPSYAPEEWKDWQSGFVKDKDPQQYWGYSLKYPRDFDRSWDVDALANAFLDGADGHVKFAFPADAFSQEKTNFAGAWLTVSHRKDSTEARCYAKIDGQGRMEQAWAFGGITYRVDETADAGAGNFYRSKVYRTLDRGTCFEVVTTLHTTNVANYADRTVKEFDPKEAESIFNQIMNTIAFTDRNPY